MPATGGPAAAYGFVFQILGTLGRALDLHLEHTQVHAGSMYGYRLRIEPHCGGDLAFESDGQRVVEQWKSRSTEEPWSAREFLRKVLPDLVRAAQQPADEYRFVTNGRIGRWRAALRFLRDLGDPQDSAPLSNIDDVSLINFGLREGPCTLKKFVRLAAGSCYGRGGPDTEIDRRVLHVLSRLRVERVDPVQLERDISGYIQERCDYVEDTAAKVAELVGVVLGLAAAGNVVIRPHELLERVGMCALPFRRWDRVRANLTVRLREQSYAVSGYEAVKDVRPRIFASTRPVLILYGESGVGKTWSMAGMASLVAAGPALCILASGRGKALEAIADELWLRGLGHERSLQLEEVARKREDQNPDAPSPWCWAFVDDINEADVDRLGRCPWDSWGIRLVLASSNRVANRWNVLFPHNRAELVEIGRFSPRQAHEFLLRHGISWATTPHEVRQLVLHPVLARMYVAESPSRSPVPKLEYELVENYWSQVTSRGGALSQGYLSSLARGAVEEDAEYPWSQETIVRAGLGERQVEDLLRTGWVRQIGDGRIECSHDRLLAWAAAAGIFMKWRDTGRELDSLLSVLRSIQSRADQDLTRLGYFPADLLWMVLGDGNTGEESWKLLEAVGGALSPLSHLSEGTFERFLPTLGSRVIRPIVQLVRQESDQPDSTAWLPARALIAIGHHERDAVSAVAAELVASNHRPSAELAVAVLKHHPTAEALSDLWDLRESAELGFARDVQVAFAACLPLDPDWLVRRLQETDGLEGDLSLVATALACCQSAPGAVAWKTLKAELLSRASGPSLGACMIAFADNDDLGCIEGIVLGNTGWMSERALEALGFLDIERAVTLVREHGLCASTIPGRLFANVLWPLARNRALDLVSAALSDTSLELEFGLLGAPLPHAVANDALQVLDQQVASVTASLSNTRQLVGTLSALHIAPGRDHAAIRLPDRLAARAAEFAASELGSGLDYFWSQAVSVLSKFRCPQLEQLIIAAMSSSDAHTKTFGFRTAWLLPTEDVRRVLIEAVVAMGPDNRSEAFAWEAGIETLAALEENAAVVSGVLERGLAVSLDTLRIRNELPPMSDDELAPALMSWQSQTNGNALVVLGISGRAEYKEVALEHFLHAEPNNEVIDASVFAIWSLGGGDDSLVERTIAQYRSGHFKFQVLRLLTKSPDTFVRSVGFEVLRSTSRPYDEVDQRLMLLLEHVGPRSETVPFFRALNEQPSRWIFAAQKAREVLEEDADPYHVATATPAIFFPQERTQAIVKLAQSDKDTALDIVALALKTKSGGVQDLIEAALRVDLVKSTPFLLAWVRESSGRDGARQLGLALHELGGVAANTIADLMDEGLETEDWERRRAIACVCAWLRGRKVRQALFRLANEDSELRVRREASLALERQRRFLFAGWLTRGLRQQPNDSAWASIQSIVECADPALLGPNGLRLASALRGKSYILRRSVQRKIDETAKARKKLSSGWED